LKEINLNKSHKPDFKAPARFLPLIQDNSRDQVLVAHRGWAKTLYMVFRCIFGTDKLTSALRTPNSLFWIAYPTYNQGKKAAWPMLKDIALRAGAVKVNETDMQAIFSNGSIVQIVGTDNPNSLRGPKPHGVCLDEWAYHDPHVFTSIIVPALADKQGWTIKGFTPNGKNHAYADFETAAKKFFYDAETSGVYCKEELEKIKKEVSLDEYSQEMMCQFIHYAGQIYKEYSPAIHWIEKLDYPKDWTRFIGLDFGIAHNTAVVFCVVSYDGTVYVVDSIYTNDQEVEYYANGIKARGWGDVPVYISPETVAKDRFKKGVKYSVYQEFLDNGIRAITANSHVIAGINKIRQMLNSRKLMFLKGLDGIEEMELYRWKDNALKDTPVKVKDDFVDAVRYAIATHFSASELPQPPKKDYTEDYFKALQDDQYGRTKELQWVS
jgi:hypothetical protein